MTTKITVEVPATAEYQVAISTETVPLRGRTLIFVQPGESHWFHIHDGMRVVEIAEVPPGNVVALHTGD
jgi:hypothetical protein